MQAGAWQAADRSVAVALANIAGDPVPIHIAMSRREYPLPVNGVVNRITEHEHAGVMKYSDGHVVLDLTLDPFDVRIYEFAAK